MVAFEKPNFSFSFDLAQEKEHLLQQKALRGIPAKRKDHLLLCTWNIANLGLHARGKDHSRLIAEILSWFDVVAVQEVYDNLRGLKEIEAYIGTEYDLMFTDKGGNDERAAYLFDASKVERLQMVGELAVPPAAQRYIEIEGVEGQFSGFDRNPFIASFQFRNERLMLINAHLFFGSHAKSDRDRRALEAYAVGRYADLRREDPHVFTSNIIALGDFNIPKAEAEDPIFDALTQRGLEVPQHSTKMGSSIATDAQYDQVVFFPKLKRKIQDSGVFDYDGSIFPELWERSEEDFMRYCRYYISDHRPMWVQVKFD